MTNAQLVFKISTMITNGQSKSKLNHDGTYFNSWYFMLDSRLLCVQQFHCYLVPLEATLLQLQKQWEMKGKLKLNHCNFMQILRSQEQKRWGTSTSRKRITALCSLVIVEF